MKKIKEVTEIVLDIKREIPGFKKDELLEYSEWVIPKLYYSLKNKEKIEIKCKPELINKLNNEHLKYKITENVDSISVQYVRLYDNEKREGEMYIQVYAAVYFYDNVSNNPGHPFAEDKYWNDVWIVTYRENLETEKRNSNCDNCGATMKYNLRKNVFECEYCGNTANNIPNSKWEIVDIELGE